MFSTFSLSVQLFLFLQGGVDFDDLGFDLVGGSDDPQFPNDNSIFVSHVTKGSVADRKLK